MRSSLAWRFSSALSRGVFGGMNTSLFHGAAGPNRGWLPKEMNRDSLLVVAYRATVRTEARRAEVRSRIVHAALDLVRRGGYREASVAAVAQGAGVATGTVYRYFPSKSQLFAEVFRVASQHEVDAVAAAMAGPAHALDRVALGVETFARRALRG